MESLDVDKIMGINTQGETSNPKYWDKLVSVAKPQVT
jgi:hypothetical protein